MSVLQCDFLKRRIESSFSSTSHGSCESKKRISPYFVRFIKKICGMLMAYTFSTLLVPLFRRFGWWWGALGFSFKVSGIGMGLPQRLLLDLLTVGNISFIIVSSVGWFLFLSFSSSSEAISCASWAATSEFLY